MQRVLRSLKYSTQVIPEIPLVPRLESHYYNTIYEDLMALTYDHSSPSLQNLEQDQLWNYKFTDQDYEKVYTLNINDLPTKHNENLCSNLLTTKLKSIQKHSRLEKKMKNPIDYTSIPKEDFYKKDEKIKELPFSPVPTRIPSVKKITLKIISDDAVANKQILLSAIMSLQSITGKRAGPVFATVGDASKKIRAGMPIGCKVEIEGEEMYTFLDKLVQCVLPRIREFKGLNPINNDGKVEFILPASAVGTFPDIEPHFDMFPRLFDTEVVIGTNGENDREVFMLLSAFQVPFADAIEVKEDKVQKEDDPWAMIKVAKTREERKALYAKITAARRSKEAEE